MQAKKKVVALIETAAGNVDAAYQRAILTRYAELHQMEVDTAYGERAPLAQPVHALLDRVLKLAQDFLAAGIRQVAGIRQNDDLGLAGQHWLHVQAHRAGRPRIAKAHNPALRTTENHRATPRRA